MIRYKRDTRYTKNTENEVTESNDQVYRCLDCNLTMKYMMVNAIEFYRIAGTTINLHKTT